MNAGGGHATSQWFGMYYAGQPGRRLPVPIFQALEDFTVFVILILIERALDRWPDGTRRVGYPPGIVLGTGMILWGIDRALDEHLWLGGDSGIGSDLVQVAGILLVVGGLIILVRTRSRWREWLGTHHAGDADQVPPSDVAGLGAADNADTPDTVDAVDVVDAAGAGGTPADQRA
jgi:hypothetical protein